MARLNWALFCSHHLTDQQGNNSYIEVFDTVTMDVHVRPGAPPPQIPLEAPKPSCSFVLAAHITAAPGSPTVELRVKDSDGELVAPPAKMQLSNSDLGRHSLHVNFSSGIPVRRSGIYAFEFVVAGEKIGVAELPIDIRGHEGGES